MRAASAGPVALDEAVADGAADEVAEVEEFGEGGDLAERLVVGGAEEAVEGQRVRGDHVLRQDGQRGGGGGDGPSGGGEFGGPAPGEVGEPVGAFRGRGGGEPGGQ